MKIIGKRFVLPIAALAVLFWAIICTIKLMQLHSIARQTRSSLVKYDPEASLRVGNIIEYQMSYGYAKIIGIACKEEANLDLLSRYRSINRLLVSGIESNDSFCMTLAKWQASSVTLCDMYVDSDVVAALSRGGVKDLAFLACRFEDGNGFYRAFSAISLSSYVFLKKTSQSVESIPMPCSASMLFISSSTFPRQLRDLVLRSGSIESIELWISDYEYVDMSWVCNSASLKNLVLRGRNCNTASVTPCYKNMKVVVTSINGD